MYSARTKTKAHGDDFGDAVDSLFAASQNYQIAVDNIDKALTILNRDSH